VTSGTLTQAIAAGESTVTVKLTRKAWKALQITMTVTDVAGNATTRTTTVTVKR
jgi:hypothetical protein